MVRQHVQQKVSFRACGIAAYGHRPAPFRRMPMIARQPQPVQFREGQRWRRHRMQSIRNWNYSVL